MEVKLYKLQKRENSTFTPDDNVNIPFTADCVLKDNCSVVNPVLEFNAKGASALSLIWEFNYIKIPTFSRYYYVEDWDFIGGLWVCSCHVDVLASFKTDIRYTWAYIARSTRDKNGTLLYNPAVIDTKYPALGSQATYLSTAIVNPFGNSDGVYIVGVVNKSAENGTVTYYAFNQIGFKQFCRQLFTYSSGWLNIDVTEISENLQKALVNPFQYIVSCVYLPVNVSDITGISQTVTTTIYFGWWSVEVVTGARIVDTRAYISKTYSLTIPRHPQAASRGYYLNLAPFAIYTLRAYPFGTVNIDSEAIAYWNTLDLHISIDVCTGRGILNICVNGMNNPLQTIETPVGVTIPTASLQVNYQQITGSSSMLAGGAAFVSNVTEGSGKWYNNIVQNAKNFISSVKEGNAGAVIKEIAGDVASAAVAAQTTAEIRGQQGCASGYLSQTYTLSGRFLPIAPEDFDHNGRPLLQYKILDDLSGFIMCQNVDLKISCTDRERAAIESYLLSGFYLE